MTNRYSTIHTTKKGWPVACLLCIALLLGSCKDDYDISSLAEEPQLVLYCMPTTNDTTIIQLTRSVPVGRKNANRADALSVPEDATITYRINGEPQTVRYMPKNQESPNALARRFYVIAPQKVGDRIDIEASASGLNTVTATTYIPEPISVKNTTAREITRLDEDGNRATYIQVTADFTDNPTTEDYYAVAVEVRYPWIHAEKVIDQEAVYDVIYIPEKSHWEALDNDTVYTNITTCRLSSMSEDLLNPINDADDEMLYDNDFYQNFYIFEDKKLSATGKPYTLHLDAWGFPYNIQRPRSNKIYHPLPRQFRVVLYKLTPEYYRFIKSINDLRNNGLAEYGLAAVNPVYTNITGGIGMLGGWSIATSEWVEERESHE